MNDTTSDAHIDQETLSAAIELIHRFTGITMTEQKRTLIMGRLKKRLRALNLESYQLYITYLKNHREEQEYFINVVTTNETYFFRTQRVWDYFCKDYLPNWYAKHPGQTLHLWSAASSTGEEAYSMAICCEEFANRNPLFQYRIVASDISTDVLKEATEGYYEGRSVDSFRQQYPAWFAQYLLAAGSGFKVIEKLQKKVEFRKHNLFESPFLQSRFDLVFLRNVLIYFNAADQTKVLKLLARSLVKDGELIVGESDSLTALDTEFHFLKPGLYKLGGI